MTGLPMYLLSSLLLPKRTEFIGPEGECFRIDRYQRRLINYTVVVSGYNYTVVMSESFLLTGDLPSKCCDPSKAGRSQSPIKVHRVSLPVRKTHTQRERTCLLESVVIIGFQIAHKLSDRTLGRIETWSGSLREISFPSSTHSDIGLLSDQYSI